MFYWFYWPGRCLVVTVIWIERLRGVHLGHWSNATFNQMLFVSDLGWLQGTRHGKFA